MWIADQWKDYQVLDTSGPTGYLGYPEEESGLEKDEWPLPPQQKRRR